MNFRQLRQQLTDEEVDSIKRDIYIDLLFDVLILILVIHFGSDADCGIPIYMWNLVYFGILGARSIANLIKIVIVRSYP
jgi:hypothetical protein